MPSPLCEEKYQYGLVMGKRAENVDGLLLPNKSHIYHGDGSDSNLLIVFYVQIMPDDLVMQLHR
ncbi:hypothetical protein OFN30_21520, partial [Escherichia coli]